MSVHESGTIGRIVRSRNARQLAAAVTVVLALWVRMALERQGISLPTYITFYPVVLLAALLGGVWTGLLATALSALFVDYFVLPPIGHFSIGSTSDIVAMAIFGISGVAISVITELYHRNREKLAAYQMEAAVMNERRKVEEALEQAEIVCAERLRFLDVLETLRTMNTSTASSEAVPISREFSAAGRESWFPSLDRTKFRALLRRTIIVPFMTALIVAGAVLWAAYNLNVSMQWVDHTDQVIGGSQRVLRLLVDMETGERGYLVTGNDVFLQPYREASNAIDSEYRELHRLVADNPPQQARLERLYDSLHHWQRYAEHMIDVRRTGGAYANLYVNLAGKGEMDEIRDQLAGFQSVEEHLRDERRRTARRNWRLVAAIGILLGLGAGTGLAVFTRRRMKVIAASFEKAGRALAESERRWATTLASIGDAVISADTHGLVTFLNPVASALTGWQYDEAHGQPMQNVFQTINEKTRVPAEDIVNRVLREKRVVELANHTVLLAKDGREILIEDSAAPIPDSDGNIVGVVLVFRDVTGRKQAETVFQATLQRFYTILSNLNSSILLVSDEGKIEFVNQTFCDLFELKESPAELMAAFDSEKVIAKIDTAYQNPEPAVLRVREIVKLGQSVFGEEIPLQNGATVLRDFVPLTVDGKSYGRMWVLTDISDRVLGEQFLRENRAKLAAALASMTDSVIITDAEGRFLDFNDAYAKLYRFKSKIECARNFDEFTSLFDIWMANGDPAPREMYAIPRALRGETEANVEYTIRRKDTGEIWIGSLSFSPIRDDDGTIAGAVVTARDITEAKRAEEERQIAIDFLGIINQSRATGDLIQSAAAFFQERSGCEAVGIRMREGDDFPYFEARGFSPEFVHRESRLCAREASGEVVRDSAGDPLIECLCGSVLRGRFEPSKPFYTAHGSFWTNSTTALIASASEADLPSSARHRCHREGYESVALFPICDGEERLGLLQLNDRRKGIFSPQKIAFWEKLAGYLATAISKFQAEEALQESEKRYRTLFNSMDEGFCIIEVIFDAGNKPVDYRFLQVNAAFERQTGLHEAEGKLMRELAPDHEAHWFEIYGKIALTGEPAHFQDEAKALNRYYSVSAYRVGEPEQRRVAIVFDDISEIKRAEEALRASEEQFRNLANAIPQLCWMADANGSIFWYNERWYEYTGTTLEQMEGWGWQSVHDPDALPLVMERWGDSLAMGSLFDMVFPIRGADGVFRPFLTRVMPVKDMDGKVARWFGTNTDISEQKHIEAELRKNQERLNIALEVARLGEWERNLKDQTASHSLRHAQIFGYKSIESEWNFEKVLSHVLPQYRAEVTEWYKSSLAGGTWEFETQIRRIDGEVRWLWFRSHIRLDEMGQPANMYGIVMDITERKRAEEQLKKINRTLTAMSNSNQAILLATDETSFLQEVCRIITNDCGHAMVWVGIAEQDEDKTVRPVASAGFEEEYLEAHSITWDESERGRGPTGTAIRTGEPSMCRNMLTDPAFAPWRENAIKRGYASSLAVPLKERGEAWGAITIYAREPDAFSEGEVDLLAELAGDIEVGVQTLRMRAAHAKAEDALREREELLGLFIEHAPAALAMFDDKMRYQHASRRWMADYGLGDRDLRGVSHYDVFPETPEDWKDAHRRGMAGEVLSGEADRFERADGSERWIRWEVRPWRDAEGKIGGIVIFSEEITERKKAEEERLRSEKVALQRQQLQALAVRLQQVREEERKMVARDLHDQIGQILTTIKMDMTWVVRHLPRSKDDVHERLAKSIEMINDGVRSVRKICSGLRPGILDDLGLSAAIEWQANEFASRTGIPCQVTVPPDELHLDGDRTTAIFRIFQECLTNVARHAEARSVRASLREQDGDLLLVVQDDGKGFTEAGIAGSLGVLGMRERAQACGGSVQVSSSSGKGTTVTACVPVHAASAEREDYEHSDS